MNGEALEKSLFKPVYQKQVNGLEKDVAWYLDADKAVHWWHRIAVNQDWHLQGWQRNRVYPDFPRLLAPTSRWENPIQCSRNKGTSFERERGHGPIQ
jgi:hypothetical protein